MLPPNEPNKDDCCGSGCNPCIFDVYEKKLKLYKKFLESGEAPVETEDNALSQLNYTEFETVENIKITAVHRLITFQMVKKEENARANIWWNPGDHFLVKFGQQEKACTRAYTPLPKESCLKNYCSEYYDFAIIAKVYNGGLGSNYLSGLKKGDQTLWRGPYGSYKLEPNKFERIIIIAQGTGIVAFVSIIEQILNDEDDMTRMHLCYCCSSEDSILLREQLYEFKSYWNFQYQIFISNTSNNFTCKYQEPIVQHKLQSQDLVPLEPFTEKDQILLCGSSNFMKDLELLLRSKYEECINIKSF